MAYPTRPAYDTKRSLERLRALWIHGVSFEHTQDPLQTRPVSTKYIYALKSCRDAKLTWSRMHTTCTLFVNMPNSPLVLLETWPRSGETSEDIYKRLYQVTAVDRFIHSVKPTELEVHYLEKLNNDEGRIVFAVTRVLVRCVPIVCSELL